MKKCIRCNLEFSLDGFYKHNGMSEGRLNVCKDCIKKTSKKNEGRYNNTEKGVIRIIYKTQKRANKLRGFGDMPYTKTEFKEWLYKNNFKHLYDKWVLSDYEKYKKPSVDRIDDFKGYYFDNIVLGTWRDNKDHQIKDIMNGTGTSGRRCKPVNKISNEGKVIATYVSYNAAKRDVGYNLERQLKKGIKCRNNFYWSYV